MSKRGQKPQYGETLGIKAIRMTSEQRSKIDTAGTAAYWRNAMEILATYKIMLDNGAITLPQYEEMIGKELGQVTIHYANMEPKKDETTAAPEG